MSEVIIGGADILTSCGSLDATWDALMTGRDGLSHTLVPGFDQEWPLASVKSVTAPYGSMERLKELAQQICATIPSLGPDIPIICATTKGAPDQLLMDQAPFSGQAEECGLLFQKQLGLTGRPVTISAACASGTLALMQAAVRVHLQEEQAVLVVGIDLISRFVLAGFASLKGLSEKGCQPFDQKRDGLSLGEGGGWMLICTREFALKNGLPCLARLTGWAATCDATHITAPCRKASGLKAAILQATKRAGCAIGGINAHGTGTVYNDAMELLAFDEIFNSSLPVHSLKGTIGHCLGAAGIIETAVGLKSLATGQLPPTHGLQTPEAKGGILSGTTPLALKAPSLITCNSGFGGINSVLVLESGAGSTA